MQFNLEPPKPTEEFHKAYEEISGKKKKEEKRAEADKELEMLDIPPIRLSSAESFVIPSLPEEESSRKTLPTLPPLELDVHEELFGGGVGEKSFFAGLKLRLFKKIKRKKEKEKKELFMLAEPPKRLEQLPLLEKEEIETPQQELERVIKKEPRIKEVLREERKEEEKVNYPILSEEKESSFERTMVNKGARDLQMVFEKKHPHEIGGFEYLEKIKPLTEVPTVSEDAGEKIIMLKKEKRRIKEIRKREHGIILWTKKQQKQEKRIDEKIKKIETMEKELQEKQYTIAQYEPKMQELYMREDAILEKEREIKQRQVDIHETETQLKAEENAIIAKIKKLEADQRLLEKEQNAIIRTVEKLDKERLQISAKNKEFKEILKKITTAERELKEKAQILDDREQRIKKKEKLLEIEVSRVQKLKKTAEHLKGVEETYARMRERLRIAYKEYEERFSNQKVYAPQEIKAIPLQPTFQPVRPLYETKAVESGDITNLITATKQLIIDKHYDEANKNINRLMQRYIQIPETNPRKKEIYYEIAGLKNMLKLDLLE